jgi:hypothetical protein
MDPTHDKQIVEQGQESDGDVAIFRFDYIIQEGDWRIAADSAESLDAVRRILRVPVGIVLTMVGILQFFEDGAELIGRSKSVAWRPRAQDREFRERLRRGTHVVLDMTLDGMVFDDGSDKFTVGWPQIEYAIDSSDGLLMKPYVLGPIWIPVRAFSNWEQQCEVHRFVEGRGVEQRSYGSG